MKPTEKVALAMAWYDSGLENRAAFQTLMESLFAQPEQKPLAWISAVMGDVTTQDMSHTVSWVPLYTTPPQRKPLSEGEVGEIYYGITRQRATISGSWIKTFARAIEAAHNIKE
jgi:hypothetical protein